MEEKIIEVTENQSNTILTIVYNLHWDLVREMLDFWTDKHPAEWSMEKIKRADKLVSNLQELESIIKGIPIK